MRILKCCRSTTLACGIVLAVAGGVDAAPAADRGHAHAHPGEGPHRGTIIELGKEDYHAELVHDEKTDTVTIHVLDASATKAMPIPAKQLTLNVRAGGKPRQFLIKPVPQVGEPADSSSVFAVTDKELCRALDAPGATGRLNVEIGGKVYVGKLGCHTHAH
ncbi:MAG: hypothetical protein EBR23_07825 [Planctomycetia bacterium]|nr:hypothetical protein [Planctomycetia bacterium]